MDGAYPGMPVVQFPIVDVREVAFAHLQGIKVPEARNQRFILCTESLWFKQIAETLKEEYGEFYKFKTGELKYCTVKLASFFDPSVRIILPLWRKSIILNNERSRKVLGIEYRDTKTTINEMALTLIACGQIAEKRKPKK